MPGDETTRNRLTPKNRRERDMVDLAEKRGYQRGLAATREPVEGVSQDLYTAAERRADFFSKRLDEARAEITQLRSEPESR